RPGGWMQQSAVPRCAILSEAREASGSETPRVHNVARWCGGVAAHGAGAAGGDATGRRVHASFAERPGDEGLFAALAQGLAPLGWSQSRNLQLIFRISGGDDPTANAAAADLVRQNPEVILSHGTETSRIVQQHTSAIPIVFTTVTDPVGSGLVESLA